MPLGRRVPEITSVVGPLAESSKRTVEPSANAAGRSEASSQFVVVVFQLPSTAPRQRNCDSTGPAVKTRSTAAAPRLLEMYPSYGGIPTGSEPRTKFGAPL